MCLRRIRNISLLAINLVFISASQAQLVPDPLPGWTHDAPFALDTDAMHGVVLGGREVVYSNPVIAEIDGDSSNGKEVAIGSSDGTVYVLSSQGQILWSRRLTKCKRANKKDRLYSSPAVGELFGDGVPYVVVGYGGIRPNKCPGGVWALRGSNGAKKWHFSTKRYSKQQHFWAINHGVFSTPALADVDGDGRMEVGFGSYDRNVYLLEANGKPRWYYLAADTVWSSPIFVDLDGDDQLEMVIGTDISQNKYLSPPTQNGGYLYAFKTEARSKKQIGFRDESAYLWQTSFDQVIFSTPAWGDVLSENEGPEIVIGTGCYFPERSRNKNGNWFKIIRPSDGKVLKTLEVDACSPSTPALVDIDDDGLKEVIVTVSGNKKIGGAGKSKLIAWDADLGTKKWEIIPRFAGGSDSYGGDFLSPVVADLDGNGSLEVAMSVRAGVGIYDASTGTALVCEDRSCSEDSVLLPTFKTMKGTPAIGDVDGDGVLDLIAAGGHKNAKGQAVIYGWTNFADYLTSEAGTQDPFSAPWPMFKFNPTRSGL